VRQPVQRLGRNVRSVRPHNRPGDWIEQYSSEEGRVSQRLEDRPCQQRETIDPLAGAILEPQVEGVWPGYLDALSADPGPLFGEFNRCDVARLASRAEDDPRRFVLPILQ
jgi:hypothetical protein